MFTEEESRIDWGMEFQALAAITGKITIVKRFQPFDLYIIKMGSLYFRNKYAQTLPVQTVVSIQGRPSKTSKTLSV